MNPFIKTFVAAGAIAHRRLVAFTDVDGELVQATASSDRIAGILDMPGGAVTGQRIDVILFGPAEVEFGGTVKPGEFITSDADGKAVAAAPAADANSHVAGRALANAVSGDIARTMINPGLIQGA